VAALRQHLEVAAMTRAVAEEQILLQPAEVNFLNHQTHQTHQTVKVGEE
jgi:hypothetical protein